MKFRAVQQDNRLYLNNIDVAAWLHLRALEYAKTGEKAKASAIATAANNLATLKA